MLVEIFREDGMPRIGIPVQVRDCLMRQKIRRSRDFGVFRKGLYHSAGGSRVIDDRVRIRRRNQISAIGQLVIEQRIGDGINVPRRGTDDRPGVGG